MYGNNVRLVWKHLPLDMHKDAPAAHRASLAAYKQGKFWEYHDKLFSNQRDLEPETFRRYAQELGLDLEQFDKDSVDAQYQKLIDADKSEARSMGVTGAPGFFINGRFLRGAQPFEKFANLINAELTRANIPVPAEAQVE